MIRQMPRGTHDTATGLPNELLLHDRISQALAAAPRRKGTVAVLAVDVEGTDVLFPDGEYINERLIEAVAQRIRRVLRAHDTVARLDRGPFAVACEGIPDGKVAAAIASRIRQAAGGPPHREPVYATVRVGFALAAAPTDSAEALIARAHDQAMKDAVPCPVC